MPTPVDCTISMLSIRHGVTFGLGSSTYNLISGLTDLGKTVEAVISKEELISPDFLAKAQSNPRILLTRGIGISSKPAARFLEEVLFANLSAQKAPQLYLNYFLPPSLRPRRYPVGVIVHDCQHRSLSHNFSEKKRAWLDFNFARTLDRADHVYLISEFERSQIARFFGEARAARCQVIYNSINFTRYEEGEVSERIAGFTKHPFILLVDNPGTHKNTKKAISAFAHLCERESDTFLVLIGRPTPETRKQLESEVPEAVRHRTIQTNYVADRDLGELYRKCALYVTASSYEGFGMPAVEAMGLGAPVLATEGTSLPEVTLGRAQYVPEGASPAEWAEAMAACLTKRPDTAYLDESVRLVREKYAPTAVAHRIAESLLG